MQNLSYSRWMTRGWRYGVSCLTILLLLLGSMAFFSSSRAHATASSNPYSLPNCWGKYQLLLNQNAKAASGGGSFFVGANVDVSNEDTSQSETAITLNPKNPNMLVAGSNEIVRLPMRGYFSSNGGSTWGAVDLPLPPPATTNGTDFGSDPGVPFDTHGNVYYSYIVVFFNRTFRPIQGTEMSGSKSSDRAETC